MKLGDRKASEAKRKSARESAKKTAEKMKENEARDNGGSSTSGSRS